MVLVILFNTFLWNFAYVEAKSSSSGQPEVCNWPSEMMAHYFNFQREARELLKWSIVNAKRYATYRWEGGLFVNNVLTLSKVSTIDFLLTDIVWSAKSFVSNSITSFVLFLLASASVVQSNTEWFAILFKDRPIVRDYKETLEIETELFNVAYFRSKQINLTQPFESTMLQDFYVLIEKYQDLWLFQTGAVKLEWDSMADMITNLVAMNAVMKQFIMVGWKVGRNWLENYAMCASDIGSDCSGISSSLRFSSDAINQLDEAYKEVRKFSKCNSYANLFRGTLNKTIKNNSEMVKSSVDDVKAAVKRLWSALVGKNNWEKKQNRCDVSDYEMAQLQAYRGWTWECNTKLVDVDVNESLSADVRAYFNEIQAQRRQKQQQKTLLSAAGGSSSNSVRWNESFDSYYLQDMDKEFENVFDTTLIEFWQAQENAKSSDMSALFGRGKWILDTIDSAIEESWEWNGNKWLKSNLQKIEDRQCTG